MRNFREILFLVFALGIAAAFSGIAVFAQTTGENQAPCENCKNLELDENSKTVYCEDLSAGADKTNCVSADKNDGQPTGQALGGGSKKNK